jgi:hypothetical protein
LLFLRKCYQKLMGDGVTGPRLTIELEASASFSALAEPAALVMVPPQAGPATNILAGAFAQVV